MTKRKVARDSGDGEFITQAEAAADPDGTVVETIEFPDDLASPEPVEVPEPSYHTILEVWREVLKPARAESIKSPTPQWSTNILSQYLGLSFKDMLDVRDVYFGLLDKMYVILLAEIKDDPDALSYANAQEDLENNRPHYINLITSWQVAFLTFELDWDCQAEDAAARIAGMQECHKLFFGQTGLLPHLDNIKLEFTEADQEALQAALNEVLEARGESGE